MRILAALGGNALLRPGETPSVEIQRSHVTAVVRGLAPLAREHELVVTHGNGPQVGLLALESANDPLLAHPYPFDVLGAESQGMIGYLLLQALANELPDHKVVGLLTQTIVSEDDPAFAAPTKFVGPVYDESTAHRLAAEHGWDVRPDGARWRRVVASPDPLEIVELASVRALLAWGAVIVCAGGGGVPVVRAADGRLRGVEAVVDKDLAAALLATSIGADLLLILTNVDGVYVGFGTSTSRMMRAADPRTLRAVRFPAGSMGPKVEAACRFAEDSGRRAVIGQLADVGELVSGARGTSVTLHRS